MGIEVGSILEGKVTGITNFGAFVALPGNRSGLVHISEIAYSYVNDVHDHLAEGQEVKVKVIGVDANNRINLSIKQAAPPPPRPERHSGPRSSGPNPHPRPEGARRPAPGRGFAPEPVQPKGPASFEDQLNNSPFSLSYPTKKSLPRLTVARKGFNITRS